MSESPQPATANLSHDQQEKLVEAAAFDERIGDLTERMPEHAATLTRTSEIAQDIAEQLKPDILRIVDAERGSLRGELKDEQGNSYSFAAPPEEVEEVSAKLARQQYIRPDNSLYSTIEEATKEAISRDRKEKIGKAANDADRLGESEVAQVSEEEGKTYVEEGQKSYWKQSQAALDELDKIANTGVASLRERGVIMGGVAINKKAGPLEKYFKVEDKHRHFDSVLRGLRGEFSKIADAIRSGATPEDIRRHFPQLDPNNPTWETEIRKIGGRLDAELALRDYLPQLKTRVVELTSSHAGNTGEAESAYQGTVIAGVQSDIQQLRETGKTNQEIYKTLAQRYHPDKAPGSAGSHDQFGYLAEWREGLEADQRTG